MKCCRCCALAGITRDGKSRGRHPLDHGRGGPILCDACWRDPANTYAECRHGLAPRLDFVNNRGE